MSIPRNHHHVSRCQLDKFYNHEAGRIYLYDKKRVKHFNPVSTKHVFSERDSNSSVIDDSVNHDKFEKDLNDHFESKFSSDFSNAQKIANGASTFNDQILESLIRLAKFGIACTLRSPAGKKSRDGMIKEALFDQILPGASPELKQTLQTAKDKFSATKYLNRTLYSKFAETVMDNMGEVFFKLYAIDCDAFFLLPDTGSVSRRENINNHPNPDAEEIAMIGFPLSSKLFMHVESKKLGDGENELIKVTTSNIREVHRINLAMYLCSDQQVACESEAYLTEFIEMTTTQHLP